MSRYKINIRAGVFNILLRSKNKNHVSCYVIGTNVGAFYVLLNPTNGKKSRQVFPLRENTCDDIMLNHAISQIN